MRFIKDGPLWLLLLLSREHCNFPPPQTVLARVVFGLERGSVTLAESRSGRSAGKNIAHVAFSGMAVNLDATPAAIKARDLLCFFFIAASLLMSFEELVVCVCVFDWLESEVSLDAMPAAIKARGLFWPSSSLMI